MTGRPALADVLTLGNALAGGSAILLVSIGAGWDPQVLLRAMAGLLIVATIFDALDGPAARRWGGTPSGPALDSLADATSFGVAPAVVVMAVVTAGQRSPLQAAVLLGALAYVAGALVRLARFLVDGRAQDHFVGVPTPVAALLALDVVFLTTSALVGAMALLVLGVLMVSRIRYPHQGARLVVRWSVVGWALALAGVVGLVDVRVPAVLSLLALLVVVPYAMLRRDDDAAGVPLIEAD